MSGKWHTALAPWMTDIAVKRFLEGADIAEVAGYLKVRRETLSRWLSDGSDPECTDADLVDFVQECTDARLTFKRELRDQWNQHCMVDAKAAALAMKAHFPELYDRQKHSTVDVNVTRTDEADYGDYTQDELDALEAANAAKLAAAERRKLPSGR